MTSVESRLGSLEAYRATQADDIRTIKNDIQTIDTKLDTLLATKATASWATRGLIPAFWTLAFGAALAAMVHGWH